MAHRNSDNPNVQIRNRSESTSHLADQGTGFFQWGRDLGGTDSNHKFTEHEKDLLAQYQSADYLPPYSCAYKEWLRQQPARLDWDKWLMMGIIGFVVGITGFLMHQTIGVIADLKWDRAYEYVKERNFGMAWVWLALIGIGFAIISSLLVVLFHLPAGGSGMPELIGFLNGTLIRNVFGIKTAVIKFLSCVCAVGSGLPVGPEGPMIHLGALIGGGLSQAKSSILSCILPIFGRFRNPEDERNFISAGAGAGVSAAFGAPVGGLLFTMEEVSSFWSLKHGWMTFFCCMTSTFTTDLFNSAFQGFRYTGDFGAFKSRKYILFEVKKEISLNILAFIPSLIIGMIGGLLGALFTFLNLKIARSRRRLVGRFKSTWVKNLIRVSEVTLIMTLTATMSILLPGGFGCTPYQCQNVNTTANVYQGPLCRRGDQYKIHTENEVVGYTCPVGITKNVSSQVYFTNQTYNQVASLVSVQGEEAIHRLFSRQTYLQFDIGPLATVLVLYFTLACWTAGSAVSSGLVVPMLLVGALYGRLIGRLLVVMFGVHQTGYWAWMDPGAFALVGAASFFGGVSRLTMALAVIMMEITNDIQFLLLVMVAILSAKVLGDYITHPLYHALLEMKCIPFLDNELSLHDEHHNILNLEFYTAGDVMTKKPKCVYERESVAKLARLLQETKHGGFPVIRKDAVSGRDVFVGMMSRDELEVLLAVGDSVFEDQFGNNAHEIGILRYNMMHEAILPVNFNETVAKYASDEAYQQSYLNLIPYINRSVTSIQMSFSLRRTYILFRTMGMRHLPIVDEVNRVVGILTRKDLMGFSIEEHIHGDDYGHDHMRTPTGKRSGDLELDEFHRRA